MAQKTVVTVVCDLNHDDEIEGSETVSFAFDGASYEIDVCPTQPRTGPGRERSSEIRAWAKQRGHKVSERGRIPASIIAEYEASH